MTPHLCHVFPSFGTGGPEVRTAQLINAFGDEFRHSIVALDGNLAGQSRLERPDKVRIIAGPPRSGRLRHPFALAELLRSLEPDAVFTYGWGGTDAVLAARLAHLRVIHAEDGFLPEEVQRQKRARLWARRMILRLARRVVVPSQVLVEISWRDWWLSPQRIIYIPNGVDCMRFGPPTPSEIAAARDRFGLPRDAVVIGTVSRLGAEKNQGRLLRAFESVAERPSTHLILVGDGPLRATLEKQAQASRCAERIHFLGNLGDPRDCYWAMDVFALSSDTEQMPLVVLEAMAAALPVVSTDVGDVRHMVTPDNRALVTPREDEAAYAASLARLIDDANLRRTLGTANLDECRRRFDLGTMMNAYRDLYHGVVAMS